MSRNFGVPSRHDFDTHPRMPPVIRVLITQLVWSAALVAVISIMWMAANGGDVP